MDVKFYKENKEDKSSPVIDFLKSLPSSSRVKIISYIQHLADNNGVLDGFNFKPLKGYPFKEIRVKVSNNLYRVIVHIVVNGKIIVLHIFSKHEDMKAKDHKKLIEKEFKEAQRRYNKLIK